jgi:hypothetical protein
LVKKSFFFTCHQHAHHMFTTCSPTCTPPGSQRISASRCVSFESTSLTHCSHITPTLVPLPPSSPLLRQVPATPLTTPTHFTHSPLSNPPLTNHPNQPSPHTHLALASFPTLCRCALMPSLPVSFSLFQHTLTLTLTLPSIPISHLPTHQTHLFSLALQIPSLCLSNSLVTLSRPLSTLHQSRPSSLSFSLLRSQSFLAA